MTLTDSQLAQALAWGFLAAPEWTPSALRTAVRRTLGRRTRFASAVVREVLAVYREAPVHRPAELSDLILAAPALEQAVQRAARRGVPLRARRVTTSAGAMGARRWPVPALDDLSDLARLLQVPLDQLSWLADVQGRQRRTPDGPYHLYRYRWVDRPGAVPRLLEPPTPLLRHVLRRLLDEVLVWVPVHPAAHGFVPGRSALSHARLHVAADQVVTLDLRNFFTAVTAARVRGLFSTMGYPDGVVRTLTGLVSHRTPAHVLGRMPPGGDSSTRHLLRARLRAPHLPQGAPTSPALANLACFVLDRRLAGYAAAAGWTYGRYADDLTFSGPASLAAPRLVRVVSDIVPDEGFALHAGKTRVMRSSQRQQVTGIVVNTGLAVPRGTEDRLRAVLHDARLRGPAAANREQHPHFRAHLEGRVTWAEAVNPVRGRRLRLEFDAIIWPET
jgi:RNA-directed DNA polymerase